MYDFHIDGWERLPQGNHLRCILEQVNGEVATKLPRKHCSIHWKISLHLDTYLVRVIGKGAILETFNARFDGHNFRFWHNDELLPLPKLVEVVIVHATPVEETVGI